MVVGHKAKFRSYFTVFKIEWHNFAALYDFLHAFYFTWKS